MGGAYPPCTLMFLILRSKKQHSVWDQNISLRTLLSDPKREGWFLKMGGLRINKSGAKLTPPRTFLLPNFEFGP